MMDRNALLNAIIDDGIEEIRHAYPRPDQTDKREGGIAGFSACRGLDDEGLLALMGRATARREQAATARAVDYWRHRMFEAQVEWTLNVLSAAAYANGLPTLVTPTMRGLNKAADILGVKGSATPV